MLRENFVNASTFDSFNLWAKHFEICSVHKMLFLWSKLNGWLSWNVPDFRFTNEWNQTLVRDVIMIKASNRKLIFDKSHVGLPIRMCTCQHAMNTNYDHFNLTIPDIWWFPLLLLRFRLLFNFFSSACFGLGELNWTCTFWNENTHRPSTHTSKWKPQAGIKHTHNIRVHFAFSRETFTRLLCNRLHKPATERERETAFRLLTTILLGSWNVTIYDKHVWYGKTKNGTIFAVVVIFAEQRTESY